MGFDSGGLSVRRYDLQGAVGLDALEGFARQVVPPLETLGREPLTGWVGPRHLMDREIEEGSCLAGNWLRVTLMRAERKIPAALLRAHCRLEEQIELRAREVAFLNRATRREIKERVVERLLPGMPPSLTGIGFACDIARQTAYAEALSEKQQDAFALAFRQAAGFNALPLTPEVAALSLKAVNVRDLDPVCFAPDGTAAPAAPGVGLDFLTWLWFFCETEEGRLPAGAGGRGEPYFLLIEGPLTFVVEGEGAHEAVLRKGMPLLSAEAKTALMYGKKLRRAKLTLARGDSQWSAAVDGQDFAFRSLKLPKIDAADAVSQLQERLRLLHEFSDVFYRAFERFLDLRRDAAAWRSTCAAMGAWITGRSARA